MTRTVAIEEIDRTDKRFHLRLESDFSGLLKSLEDFGQRTRILLWGRKAPYIVVDGFRRVEALSALGRTSVAAIVRSDLDEEAAFALAYCENCERATLRPRDKAHAVWLAIHRRGLAKLDVAAAFGLSVRQIDRYLQLFELSAPIMEAVSGGRISMVHGLLLRRQDPAEAKTWIEDVERDHLSAADLRAKLKPNGRGGRARSYLIKDVSGFRLKGIRYRHDMPQCEKRRIWDALEGALRIIAQSS